MRKNFIQSINDLNNQDRNLAALAICFFPSIAHAATNNPGAAGAPLFLACAIAYLTRRRAIGGWLLYFYFQLYISLIIWPLLFAINIFKLLPPSEWDDKGQYLLFLLGTVPFYMAMAAETFFATVALFRRDIEHVLHLRYALIALVVTATLSLVVDFQNSPDNFPEHALDFMTLSFAAIWCIYFYRSDRVQWVLIENRWNHEGFLNRHGVPTLEQLQTGKRKGVIAAAITFALFFVIVAATSTKDDVISVLAKGGVLGTFWAAIVGVIVQRSASRPKPAKMRTMAENENIPNFENPARSDDLAKKPFTKAMLNVKQKAALLATVICSIAALMFPPFVFQLPQSGAVYNKGYAFLFSESGAIVNTGLLAIELLVILGVGIAAIFLMKDDY